MRTAVQTVLADLRAVFEASEKSTSFPGTGRPALDKVVEWLLSRAEKKTLADGTITWFWRGTLPKRMLDEVWAAKDIFMDRDAGSVTSLSWKKGTFTFAFVVGNYKSTVNSVKFTAADFQVPASKAGKTEEGRNEDLPTVAPEEVVPPPQPGKFPTARTVAAKFLKDDPHSVIWAQGAGVGDLELMQLLHKKGVSKDKIKEYDLHGTSVRGGKYGSIWVLTCKLGRFVTNAAWSLLLSKTEEKGPKFPEPDEVRMKLRHLRWDKKAAGGQSVGHVGEDLGFDGRPTWSIEPQFRQRLDHYGNQGEGWDQEGWDEEYVGPLTKAVQAALDKEFGKGVLEVIDIGEKGHIYIGYTKWPLPAAGKGMKKNPSKPAKLVPPGGPPALPPATLTFDDFKVGDKVQVRGTNDKGKVTEKGSEGITVQVPGKVPAVYRPYHLDRLEGKA